VNFENFYSLCQDKEFVNLSDTTFTYKNDSYELPVIFDELDITNFDKLEDGSHYSFGSNFQKFLNVAGNYSDPSETSPLNAVFLRGNKIVSSDRLKFFEYFNNEDTTINVALPYKFNKMLCAIKIPEKNESGESIYNDDYVTLIDNENFIGFRTKENVDVICSKNKDLNIPDTSNPAFVSSYDHVQSFCFNPDELFQATKPLETFTRDTPNQRLNLTIQKDTLEISVLDGCKIKKSISITNVSEELIGNSFWISYTNLKRVHDLSDFNMLKFQVCIGKPAINISKFIEETEEEKIDRHIVLIQIKGE
jgi:hypothetical protein